MTSTAAFDLQGHRGARGLAPENTLPGFARALSIGVTTLELDAGVTADDVVVVSHDRRLNPDIVRGADGRWLTGRPFAVRELTFHELQRYDVGRIKPGSEYSNRFPFQRRLDKVRIPTLAAVFELTRHARNDAVRFNIETKLSPLEPEETLPPDAFARALIEAVRGSGMAQRTTIQSFDWRTLQVVQREAPEIATSYLSVQQQAEDTIQARSAEASPWTAGLRFHDHGSVPRMVKAAGGRIWSPYFGDLTPALVKEAHGLGLQVLPWTVNEPPDMERLIDWGVDGIITDYPDRLREVMADRGLPLPAPTPVNP
jgi:glycerophosphoryl diester phosphodiesterase